MRKSSYCCSDPDRNKAARSNGVCDDQSVKKKGLIGASVNSSSTEPRKQTIESEYLSSTWFHVKRSLL